MTNGKDSQQPQQQQQQQQQQHLQTTQIVQQATSPYTSQEYFTNPVLPTLPSLQVTSAGVQIQADISAGLQLTGTQSLQNQSFKEGYLDGFRAHFQPQLLLQSSQLSKFYGQFSLFLYLVH